MVSWYEVDDEEEEEAAIDDMVSVI